MNTIGFPAPVQQILERILAVLPPKTPLYLVGGAVRDILLSRPTHDLDFVLPDKAIQTGRWLAKALQAAFYPLDTERDTGRLILNDEHTGRLVIDITGFRGPDLESDLRDRDFTINAIAIDLHQPGRLIDPLGGARDLQNRILRTCSPASFDNDPIRILRAVRQAIEFDLRILPETTRALRKAIPGLVQVSSERLRDEVFNILGGPAPASAIRILDRVDALPYVFPELMALKGLEQSPPHIQDVWEHTLATLHELGKVLNVLNRQYDAETAANWALGLLSVRLGRFRQQFHDHLEASLNPDRSTQALIYLAALYHDISKPEALQKNQHGHIHFYDHDRMGAEASRSRGKALRLSNPEVERLGNIVRFHMRPLLLAQSADLPSRRTIYRFFRGAGESGIDVCLLALADTMATYGPGLPDKTWMRTVDVVRSLLEAWWEQPEKIISPPVLLTGDDLIQQFNLKPGPQVGKLLEMVREAQAAGELEDRTQALAFARAKLDQG